MSETKALAPVQSTNAIAQAPAFRPGRPLITAETLVAEGQQRQLLMQYVSAHMREGDDYGVIPGTGRKDSQGNETGKKTLLKPGAEKLVDLFRCVPEYEIIEKVEDWDKPLFHYLFKCRIRTLDTGAIVAEGVGACNTRESKYRYRNGERSCPSCGKPAIKKSKFPPRDQPNVPPGFYCYDKAGGCGANFAHNDRSITDQVVGKVDNPDVADSINTVLKMAKKRALVDAAISLVRCSDMFTQDAEDFEPSDSELTPQRPATRQSQPPVIPTANTLASDRNQFKKAFRATGVDWADFAKDFNDSWLTSHGPSDLTWDVMSRDQHLWSAEYVINELRKRQPKQPSESAG